MQKINQFKQSPELGMLDLRFNPGTYPAQIDETITAQLIAGQAVKMVDSAGGVPKVIPCAADSDECFGFICYDLKSPSFTGGMRCEVAAKGNCMYLKAAGAIARQSQVVLNVAEAGTVATAASGKKVVGYAYDKAANGELFRVILETPSFKTY